MKSIRVGNKEIGPNRPCFIIAEAGVNHNGDIALAMRLIDAAAEAGVDAVKFQTYIADHIVSPQAPKGEYQLSRTDVDESQLEMLMRLELPFSAFEKLFNYCQQCEILFLSTPFDEESADFLADLGVAAYKLSSGEITNTPFLAHMASYRRPMIVSTGMSNLNEVETAVRTIEDAGNHELILLHCVSNYPADPADVNLRAMDTLSEAFGYPVGYSDHTLGIEVAIAAVALGACVIEKHFTLDRDLPGPDHNASLEPSELEALVRGIRLVEASLGDGNKQPAGSEANTAAVARKSLVAATDISTGTKLTIEMIDIKRPGTGLAPGLRQDLIGRIARQDIPAGTLLTWEMLQ
jgi:N-acetylneuraminate synthase